MLGARKKKERDYNLLVTNLNEEALRDAHANYLSKLKKKAEQERRYLRKEFKRKEMEVKLKKKSNINIDED
jgi:hypothetical protein